MLRRSCMYACALRHAGESYHILASPCMQPCFYKQRAKSIATVVEAVSMRFSLSWSHSVPVDVFLARECSWEVLAREWSWEGWMSTCYLQGRYGASPACLRCTMSNPLLTTGTGELQLRAMTARPMAPCPHGPPRACS